MVVVLTSQLLLLLAIISIAHATLSPKDTKQRQQKEKSEKKFDPVHKDVFQRSLVKTKVKAQDILANHRTYYKNTNLRHYVSGEFLGYITPWNADGYENAKKFHGKLDLVSPVWLVVNGKNPLKIPTDNLQKLWLHEIKALNNENHTVSVLPRIYFDQWSRNDIEKFYSNKKKQSKFMEVLTDLADAYSFDGYVLEMWNQFIFTEAERMHIIYIINAIANALRKKNLNTILAIPPYRNMEGQLFSKEDFDLLSDSIRYFSLMTYEYSSIEHPGPNAPTNWIKKCITYLVPNNNDLKRAQILMGLNFYGYHYTRDGGSAIIGNQYLQNLKKFSGTLQWDERSEEHFFELKSEEGGYIFFPTLYSIMTRLEIANELKTGVAIWELGQGLTYFFDIL